jgi:Tol biopolymer transport system component
VPAPTTETFSSTPTLELAPPPEMIVAPTLAPSSTPAPTAEAGSTPVPRMAPEDWMNWPVVPTVTSRAIEIYKQGLAMGNDPHAFSKVGDCQSIKEAYMGYFDIPTRYKLGDDTAYLKETIDNFSGHFNTDGQAVRGGFNAAAVLSPLWADPKVCLAGENPLECELRITKPGIVFVSLEVWWDGRTPEQYEALMRRILDTIIAHGAVPILATKADNVEGNHSLNLATARLAFEYDLPLWNFWAAVQPLPNHGMDPERADGFHIATEAWGTRSFTALQALDSIWHGLRDSTATANVPLPTATLESTPVSGLLPVPADGPFFASSADRIVFDVLARTGSGYESQGIYLLDHDTGKKAQLLGPGFTLQSASPDGKQLLVSAGSFIYATDGSSLTQLTDQFYSLGGRGALWLPDGSIAFTMQEDGGTALAVMQSDGSGLTIIPTEAMPIEIYPSTDGTSITWESGVCQSLAQCSPSGAWITHLGTATSQPLKDFVRPQISPDGSVIAYAEALPENRSNLAFAKPDGTPIRSYPLGGQVLSDLAWSPKGDTVAVHMSQRSDYAGRVTGGLKFLVNVNTYVMRQLPPQLLLYPRVTWSPDGRSLAWLGTDGQDANTSIRLQVSDAASGQTTDYTTTLGLDAGEFLSVNNALWLPPP